MKIENGRKERMRADEKIRRKEYERKGERLREREREKG